MSRIDRLALLLSLAIFIAAAFVSTQIYESLPHIEDEMAFIWQARLITRGRLTVPSPQPNPDSFRVPFVVDYQGRRFGKYPPGWPTVLSAGELLHIRDFINPLITAAGMWFLYRLIKKILDEKTAVLAIALGCLSPFVWMNSGSLLSHPWTLLLTILFFISWIDTFPGRGILRSPGIPSWLPLVTSGLSLGLLALTRPWTAIAVAAPFFLYAVFLFFGSTAATRLRLTGVALIAGGTASLYFVWQYAVTGDPLLNPYTLWWPYDKVGFGPGIGLYPGGYQLIHAKANTLFSLYAANSDLFGWPIISWLFMPFGLFILRRSQPVWLVFFSMVSLVTAYAFYWTPSWIVGPRYYYEALPAAFLLTAAGVRFLAGFPAGSFQGVPWKPAGRIRFVLTSCVVGFLILANLCYYLPVRLNGLRGLYGISESCILPLRTFSKEQKRPVLVFVHLQQNYHEYSCTLDLNSPFFDSFLITAISRGQAVDQMVAETFDTRTIFHYFPGSQEFLPDRNKIIFPGSEP